jgi:hypothetical protein
MPPFMATMPIVHLSPNSILVIAIPFLDLASKPISSAIHDAEVVIRDFVPLLLFPLQPLPVSFCSVPAHRNLSLPVLSNIADGLPLRPPDDDRSRASMPRPK